MKQFTLHMIGNAHIDPVWLWRWQEGFQEVKATFRSALDRLKEYEDFIFTSSSAAYYEWVELNDPSMFEEIRQRVAEGRWCVVGGWWVQPDCNIPCGEAFVRQGLYGQRYFEEKLGVMATVGYNVDSFGHHAMLPQILFKSGLRYYVFMRPKPHEKALPGRLFWWQSGDGSSVLTFQIPYQYQTTPQDMEQNIERCVQELKEPLFDSMCFYGVGNHGGGPTKANIEAIHKLNQNPDMPRLVLSSPVAFFERAAHQPRIPVVNDDLQYHAKGCYSAHSGIKTWNRQSENLLLCAEKWSTLAFWSGSQPYPADLTRAWKDVLFNQFHDILAGTSLEAAYEDARDLYGEANTISSRALNYALQSIAWNINTLSAGGAKPIVVFNPHAWQNVTDVEIEVDALQAGTLIDTEQNSIVTQRLQAAATAPWRTRITFVASLPPMGYRVYWLTPEKIITKDSPLLSNELHVDNDRYRFEIDGDSGCIKRLFDKRLHVEIFDGLSAKAVVLDDHSDTWSHGVVTFDRVIGQFEPERARVIADGPVKTVIRVESVYNRSSLSQEFSVFRDMDIIDVRVTVDWREQFKMLKLAFPLRLTDIRVTYEIPYGHIERRADGAEETGQSWIDVSGIARDTGMLAGVSLLNNGKYSFSVSSDATLYLTVLRSPIYAHHEPAVPHPDTIYTFMDQGIQHFSYQILPHTGSWEQAGTVKKAAELNQRPVVIQESVHPGPFALSDSFVEVDQPNIIISALKKAEENDDLIIRAYEAHQCPTHARIHLSHWDREIETDFAACEIKTLRVPRNRAYPVHETDFLERVGVS